jgi:hypothetical protein
MAIAAGFTYSCGNNIVGGIYALYVANESNISSAIRTAGVVTTLTNGGSWYQIGSEDDGITFTEEIVVENNRVLYKPEFKIKLGARSNAARLFIESLAGCERFVVAHKERNGSAGALQTWVTGYTPGQALRIMGGTSTSGATIADANMAEITLGHPYGVQFPCSTTAISIP